MYHRRSVTPKPSAGRPHEFRSLNDDATVEYTPTIGGGHVHEKRVRDLIELMLDAPDEGRFYAAAKCVRIEIETNREVSPYA